MATRERDMLILVGLVLSCLCNLICRKLQLKHFMSTMSKIVLNFQSWLLGMSKIRSS